MTPRRSTDKAGAVAVGCSLILMVLILGLIATPALVAAPAMAASPSPTPSSAPSHSASPKPSSAPAAPKTAAAAGDQIPLLAYFYIWFTPTSWNRLKIDYPLVGRYSSDDAAVMREQVALAKQAGITGFLVSWKDTPKLDRRLTALRNVAAAAGFKLAIVVEGRDFDGDPLPTQVLRRSFAYLAQHYSADPVFNIFGKPLVAWSGTWLYSTKQLATITHAFGSRLMILATEKQPAAYQLIARMFRGDAYYWSSADPLHTPDYAAKLHDFSAVVHQSHGLWIAPAAPGFDARLLGGVKDVSRRNGRTLRLELNAAMASGPNAIGLISWNEYSENSEIEPSQTHGGTALKVIASLEHAKAPVIQNFDSNAPSGFHAGASQFVILGVFLLLFGGSIAIVVRRR